MTTLSKANIRHAIHYLEIARNIAAIHAGPDLENTDKAIDYAAQVCSTYPDLLTENAALKAQIQRMREMLKLLEWSDIGFAFSASHGRDIPVHRCPICNHAREYGNRHAYNCDLGILLKETT